MKNGTLITAVIVAAGKGMRMGGPVPKQYMELDGRKVIEHTLKAFEDSIADNIVIVCPQGDEDFVRSQVVGNKFKKVSRIVCGGDERFDSSFRGIMATCEGANELKPDIIMIHDGVRALITPKLIEDVVLSLNDCSACCPGVAVKDTVRIIGEDGYAISVADRKAMRSIQTPQGFHTEVILEAYDKFMQDSSRLQPGRLITDDAMLVENYLKVPVKVIEGSYENIKITTPEDLLLAEAILKKRK